MLKVELRILRRENAESAPYPQRFLYETDNDNATVAYALEALNARETLTDMDGKSARTPIAWECSCMQKKCGACAMVIDGRPSLACDTFLKGKKRVVIEPLKKFPPVRDLIVDRSVLFENLKAMRLWASESGTAGKDTYEASRCLQCGCCLEVCPNYRPGGAFFGAAAFVPAARLLSVLPAEETDEIRAMYRGHVYDGCGKSLSCQDICPAGIPTEHMLSRSNAMAVWKRKK